MLCGLLFGGGTQYGLAGEVLLQLATVPLILLCIKSVGKRGFERFWWPELLLIALILSIPLLQLIPLPPTIWTHLPTAGARLTVFQALGRAPDWRPLSVTPDLTALSELSLLPPIAMFFGVRMLSSSARLVLVLAILAVATVSIFLELAQLAGGEQSPLRFYPVTNTDDAVGFFANRNHFAAFLYVSMTLVAPWALDSGISFLEERRRKSIAPAQLAIFLIAITLTLLLGLSQILTRSRAGMVLAVASVAWIGVLVITDPRNRWRKSSMIALIASVAVIFLVAAQTDLTRIADRLSFDPRTDTRVIIADHTIAAIKSFLPFGTGLGSFRFIYTTLETPGDLYAYTFINAAHDDFLQVALETGVPGLVAIALLVLIVLWRALELFFRRDTADITIDLLMRRAALMGVVLMSLHSFVDYPLRTSADAILFAVCLAFAGSRNSTQQVTGEPMRRRRTRIRVVEVEVIG